MSGGLCLWLQPSWELRSIQIVSGTEVGFFGVIDRRLTRSRGCARAFRSGLTPLFFDAVCGSSIETGFRGARSVLMSLLTGVNGTARAWCLYA